MPDQAHVKITVTCDSGHVIGTWTDSIEEKYPFWCEECGDDKRMTKYPWKLTTEIAGVPEIGALQELNGEILDVRDELAQQEKDRTMLIRALADACAVLRTESEKKPEESGERLMQWDALPERYKRPSIQFLAAYFPRAFDTMLEITEGFAEADQAG